jgi:uncharacterized protein YukE
MQEQLEREVRRLISRKRSVPEIADAERLAGKAAQVENALGNMASVISSVASSWGTQF